MVTPVSRPPSINTDFKGVIFDCDGVLIDSERIACEVLMEMLHELGWPIAFNDVVRRFKGLNAIDMVFAIEEQMGHPLAPDFKDIELERCERRFSVELAPTPGIVELLQGLELPRCVASSSEPKRLFPCLAMTGIDQFFGRHIYSASQVPRGKPAPDLFLFAAHNIGIAPGACAVIEDSVPGVQAGVAAGMRVFGYADLTSGEELETAGASVFTQMSELPGLLGL